MKFKEIKQIHKIIQNTRKESKLPEDKSFVRHWNVFYNALRGRPLSLIEKTSRTPLCLDFLEDIRSICNVDIEKVEEVSYLVETGIDLYHAKQLSSLYQYLTKECLDD